MFFYFILVFSVSAFADDMVFFGVKPPQGEIKFSDEFSLTMDVSYPEQYEVLPDTSSAGNAFFDILNFEHIGDASSGTFKTSSWKVNAQAFCIEPSTFPAITWNLIENGKAVSSAKSPEFKIRASPLFDPEEVKKHDIKDVYPPVKFPHWLLIIIAIIAALAFFYYVYVKLNEKNIISFGKTPWQDTRSPYQRAYDRSVVLENSRLLRKEKFREFYTGMVAVFRYYLQEEYGIDADLMTTKDLSRRMKDCGVGVGNISKSRNFLNRADLVKFAKMRPENVNKDLEELRSILQSFDMEHTPVDIGAAGIGIHQNYAPDSDGNPGQDYSRYAPAGYGESSAPEKEDA